MTQAVAEKEITGAAAQIQRLIHASKKLSYAGKRQSIPI
jgi:hypothetical protein